MTDPARAVLCKPPPKCAPPTVKPDQDKHRSQLYTRPDLAEYYYRVFQQYFDPAAFQMIEPSAGTGAFYTLLPIGSFGCDIEPKCPGILEANFLFTEIESNRRIACIGNPPFGKNANLAKSFFNHAATLSDVMGFILPRTFRKTEIINNLNDWFHLVHEELVPDNAYIFRGKPRSVSTVFQIWERRKVPRALLPNIKTHPDFEFTSSEKADFAMQRVGYSAGRVHHEMWRSKKTHYFIKGNVEDIMRDLEPAFKLIAQNTAGQRSLAKSEIVSIYNARISRIFRR